MLPDGWKEIFLGNILDFKNGLNADKAAYGHGCKFVNVMDVINNTIIKHENIIGKVNTTAKNIDLFKLKYGDILFNRTSETKEEIALSSVYMDYSLAVYGGFVIRGRPKNSNINTDFSLYFFQSPSFRNQAIKSAQGVVRANIGQDSLSRILLPLPPLPEQKKIAAILSTWDRAIEGTEKLLANSQQQKKALMQQLLTGKKRLPGFTGEWAFIALCHVLKEEKTPSVSNPQNVELLTVKLHHKGTIPSGKYPRPSERGRTYHVRHSGTLIIGRQNLHNGGVAIVSDDCDGLIASNAISSFSPRHGYNIKFLYFLMCTNVFMNKVDTLTGGTGQKEVSNKDLFSIKWRMPPLPEQQAIAAVLTTADEEITAIESDLSHLRQEKKALMQQLLTGKRRVKVD